MEIRLRTMCRTPSLNTGSGSGTYFCPTLPSDRDPASGLRFSPFLESFQHLGQRAIDEDIHDGLGYKWTQLHLDAVSRLRLPLAGRFQEPAPAVVPHQLSFDKSPGNQAGRFLPETQRVADLLQDLDLVLHVHLGALPFGGPDALHLGKKLRVALIVGDHAK